MPTKTERAKIVHEILKREFPKPPVPLDHTDPYTLLIAVLLSAQCTDERVNKITPALFKKANTPKKMIKLKVSEIEDIIRPCGLAPRKAKAIYELSHMILDEHDGEVPADMEALEKMPGVGHKTASVVMAQAFDVPSVPVDTHIHRCCQRWGLTNGKNVVQTEKDIKKLYDSKYWNDLHLQIIFYARKYCSARGCDGTVCEICTTCYPNRKKPFSYNKA